MAFLRKNFAKATLAAGINDLVTQMTVSAGHNLPTAAGQMRLVIWNNTTYPDPADDPNLEIVTASYSGTPNKYNIIRAQEDTSAVSHSSGSRVALHYTAGMSEDDLTFVEDHASSHEIGGSDLIDHDQLTNTHNLNTDIDHDQLTNVHQNVNEDGSPEFAGAKIGSATDIIKSTAGVLSAVGSPTKNYAILWNGIAPVWAAQGTSFTFTIATFTYTGYSNILEMGIANSQWKAIGELSFTATYNNGPPGATPYIDKTGPGWSANLEMTGVGYEGPTTNAEAVNYPSAVNGNRQFVLYAASGAENDTETKTVYFRNKKYFGFHSTTGQLNSDETKALSNNSFVAATANDLDTSSILLTPTGSQRIHFVYPSRLDPSSLKFYLGGFETDFVDNGTFTFTNASGYEESYRDYVSPQAYDAAVALVVEATP